MIPEVTPDVPTASRRIIVVSVVSVVLVVAPLAPVALVAAAPEPDAPLVLALSAAIAIPELAINARK